MPDDPNTPQHSPPDAPQDGPEQTTPDPPILGKYHTTDQLQDGIRELANEAGVPVPDGNLIELYGGQEGAESTYKALQRIRSRIQPQQQQQQAPQQEPETPQEPNTPSGDQLKVDPNQQLDDDLTVDQVLEKAGLNGQELSQQWQSEGKLTDEQYARFKAAGYPKALVDDYLEGVQARAAQQQAAQQQIMQDAIQTVGGEQALANLTQWAASNLSADELGDPANPAPGTINARLADPKLYRGALAELQHRHRQAVGASNSQPVVEGQASGNTPPAGQITNWKERYQNAKAINRGDEQAKRRAQASNLR